MDDPNNATNVKVLRGEIATMDKEFEEFLVQLRIRNDKDPSREFSPEEVDKVRSAMRIEFNDMTLDERRTFFAMSPDDRDKWVHERVRGEEDNTTNPVTVAAAGVAGAATAYGLYHVALALFG